MKLTECARQILAPHYKFFLPIHKAWAVGSGEVCPISGVSVFKRDSQSHRSGRRTLSRLVFIGIFFFLVCSPDSRAQGIPTLDGNEWEFLRLINEYRAQLGAPALQVSAALTNAAKWHTRDMG